MQYILGLNPHLLGVDENHLAVGRDGGTTERMSDMLYVDAFGRATIVEIKKGTAKLDAIAQLLGYAEHERQLPPGELERRYRCSERGWDRPWQVRALERVRSLAEAKTNPKEHARIPIHDPQRETFEALARSRWGAAAFTLRGAPPRSLLVARDFSDNCITLINLLQGRHMNVRAVKVDLSRSSDGNLILSWHPCGSMPTAIDAIWQATGYLWDDAFLREHFEPTGWAEHRWNSYVSFSARSVDRVKFYLHEVEGHVQLETWLPDKWCGQEQRSRALTDALKQRLSPSLAWRFELPEQRPMFVSKAREVAGALLDLLLPAGAPPPADQRSTGDG